MATNNNCSPTRPPLPLTTPFQVPESCTNTLVLTTYTLTTTLTRTVVSPPAGGGGGRSSSAITFPSTYTTTDLSAYGLVAAFATSPPGGGPRFHDAGCYPPRYGELRGAWFLEHNGTGAELNAAGQVEGGCADLIPTYYSPGVCPGGWVGTGLVTVRATKRAGEEEEETLATCCPTGFTVPNGLSGEVVPVYCESVISSATGVYDPDVASWTAVDAGTVRAAGVEVRWRSGDLGMFTGAGGNGTKGEENLSVGAKAGIGVGVGLVSVAGMIGVVAMALRKRRRARKRKSKGKEKGWVDDEDGGGEKGWAKSPGGLGELDNDAEWDGRRELEAQERVGEVDGREVVEIGGEERGESSSSRSGGGSSSKTGGESSSNYSSRVAGVEGRNGGGRLHEVVAELE
ncbi:hypothetical protein GE09DRAFT_733477 [Coniochaeta sp. 2T2.1]|nr:hypothetical protein GE09DRAFT_733477 [Coniochaeta sp. 2T2.1]